jgi:hypothetical protein
MEFETWYYFGPIFFDYLKHPVESNNERSIVFDENINEVLKNQQYNDGNIQVSYIFKDGMLCANNITFKHFNNLRGKKMNFFLTPMVYQNFFPFFKSKNQVLNVIFDIDNCKVGEIFDSKKCINCPRNTYFQSLWMAQPTYAFYVM